MSWMTPGNVFRPFSSSDWSFRSLLDEFDADEFFGRDAGGFFSSTRRPHLDRLIRRHHRTPVSSATEDFVRSPASPMSSATAAGAPQWYSRTADYAASTTSAPVVTTSSPAAAERSFSSTSTASAASSQVKVSRSSAESPHQKNWTTAINLVGFKPEEIAVKCEGDKLRIRARREEGEDLNEVRRTLTIPSEVDADKVSTILTVEGALVVKAPLLGTSQASSHQLARGSSSDAGLVGADDTLSCCSQDLSWDDVRSLVRGPGIQPLGCLVAARGDGEKAEKVFRAEILVREFHPQEIKVCQKGDQVYVEAESRQEREGQVEMRRLERSFTLPRGVDVENLVSRLCEDGRLVLEAPFMQVAEPASGSARTIQIEGVTAAAAPTLAPGTEPRELTGGK